MFLHKLMHDLVCKFVYIGDKEFGESVDVHKNRVIVKSGTKFYAIPLDLIVKTEKEKIILKEFDKKEAELEGKKWVKEKSKPVSLEELKKYGFE